MEKEAFLARELLQINKWRLVDKEVEDGLLEGADHLLGGQDHLLRGADQH